jgi:myo-inositol-1(or 4)-monophosphatase
MNGDDQEGVGDGSHALVRDPSSALCRQLEAAVRRAGEFAREAFGKPVKTWLKDRSSPVTEIDMAVDEQLRDELAAIAPDAGWLSEETPPARLAAPRLWVVDPIDGTRAFIAGQPDWTVSVALVEAGRPVAAALYAPVSEEFFLAAAGTGAMRNGIPIGVSRGDAVAGARIGGPKGLLERLGAAAPGLVILPRTYSLALRLARVADGTLDIALAGRDAHDWDLAAADLLVHEAGGALTTAAGTVIAYNGVMGTHGVLVAANKPRHHTLCALLRQHDVHLH